MRDTNMTLSPDAVLVLGGSFNPVTIAHVALMAHALDKTGAGTGVFVPSSENYVGRKVKKTRAPYLLSEGVRADMLRQAIKADDRMDINLCEYGDDGRGHSYRTMRAIQTCYPGRPCWFMIGADNLRILPRWHDIERFLAEFHFLILSRGDVDIQATIQMSPILKANQASLTVIDDLKGYNGISSSKCQQLMKQGEYAQAAAMLHGAVYTRFRKEMGGK